MDIIYGKEVIEMKTDMETVLEEMRQSVRDRKNAELRARFERTTAEEVFRSLCAMRGLFSEERKNEPVAG